MLLMPTNSLPDVLATIPASCLLFGESYVVPLTDLSPRGPGYVTRGVDVFMNEVPTHSHPPPQLTDSSSCRHDWDPPRGPAA